MQPFVDAQVAGHPRRHRRPVHSRHGHDGKHHSGRHADDRVHDAGEHAEEGLVQVPQHEPAAVDDAVAVRLARRRDDPVHQRLLQLGVDEVRDDDGENDRVVLDDGPDDNGPTYSQRHERHHEQDDQERDEEVAAVAKTGKLA